MADEPKPPRPIEEILGPGWVEITPENEGSFTKPFAPLAQSVDGRAGSITVSYSAVTEAELELIKDVLERLKPKAPTAPTWRSSALQAVSSLGMLGKVLQDFLKSSFDIVDLTLLAVGLTGLIMIYLGHQDALRKYEEDLKKFNDGDIHHNRAIEYAATLLKEQRERVKRAPSE